MTELEFLPEDYLKARFHRRVGFIRSWLLLALGLAMVLWSLQMGAWVRDARAELQALRGAGFAVASDVEKLHMLRSEARNYGHRLAVIKELEPRAALMDTVAIVTGLMPAPVSLEDLRVSWPEKTAGVRPLVRITGLAPTEGAVSQFLGRMESSKAFARATLVESKSQTRGGAACRWFVIEAENLEAGGEVAQK